MNSDRVYLHYIVETISNIEELAAQGKATIDGSKHDRAAMLYYLQTMAEATQRLSEATRQSRPEIDWQAISGFRNRLVHGYLNVNFEIVWSVVEHYLPDLKRAASAALESIEPDAP